MPSRLSVPAKLFAHQQKQFGAPSPANCRQSRIIRERKSGPYFDLCSRPSNSHTDRGVFLFRRKAGDKGRESCQHASSAFHVRTTHRAHRSGDGVHGTDFRRYDPPRITQDAPIKSGQVRFLFRFIVSKARDDHSPRRTIFNQSLDFQFPRAGPRAGRRRPGEAVNAATMSHDRHRRGYTAHRHPPRANAMTFGANVPGGIGPLRVSTNMPPRCSPQRKMFHRRAKHQLREKKQLNAESKLIIRTSQASRDQCTMRYLTVPAPFIQTVSDIPATRPAVRRRSGTSTKARTVCSVNGKLPGGAMVYRM